MTAIETIIEDIKRLPPDKFEEVASYVHLLVEMSSDVKADILKRTATALSAQDVDEMEKAIAKACEDTDEHAW